MKKLIYFDNAATTYPKPESVYRTADKYSRKSCGNPSRGSHSLALAAADAIYRSREALAGLFSALPENVAFTMNTTYALNFAIKSLVRPGDHILISNMEHNSVLRPVHELSRRLGVTYDIFRTNGSVEDILKDIESKRERKTRLLVCTHQSNILPITMPVEDIGDYCRERGIYMIVDCAQSAGTIELDMSRCKVDAVCVPGHKGLYGFQGCGAVIFGDIASEELRTTIEGGSGSESIPLDMPFHLPDRFEAGTLSSPAIVTLSSGINFVRENGPSNILAHEKKICGYIMKNISRINNITVYNDNPGSTMLFNINGKTPSEVASAFDEKGICLRSGLHCSPLAHRTIGTFPSGAVRASFSAFNTISEAERFCEVAEYIAKKANTD